MRPLVRLRAATAAFDPRYASLAVGRSLLALSTLSAVAFAPDRALFLSVTGGSGLRCDGPRGISLWCLAGGGVGTTIGRVLTLGILAVVAMGYRPRWTCVPHWYVTFSFAASVTQPNGGDHVAQIITMMIIPMCLGDGRTWQWRHPVRPLPAPWSGASYAAHLVVRFQLVIIYGHAAISKLLVSEWRDGSAMYGILYDPDYGAPPVVADLLTKTAGHRVVVSMTWGSIAVELGIAVLVLAPGRWRSGALILGVALHGLIGTLMGLFSFALIMIGALVIAQSNRRSGRGDHRQSVAPGPTDSPKHSPGTVAATI